MVGAVVGGGVVVGGAVVGGAVVGGGVVVGGAVEIVVPGAVVEVVEGRAAVVAKVEVDSGPDVVPGPWASSLTRDTPQDVATIANTAKPDNAVIQLLGELIPPADGTHRDGTGGG